MALLSTVSPVSSVAGWPAKVASLPSSMLIVGLGKVRVVAVLLGPSLTNVITNF